MADRGVHALHLVGGDARANARAADQNSALGLAALDGAANLLGKIGKVDGGGAIRAQVNRFVARRADGLDHGRFERKARMVSSDGDFHSNSLAFATTFSTVKPNFSNRILAGADAPKESMQMKADA